MAGRQNIAEDWTGLGIEAAQAPDPPGTAMRVQTIEGIVPLDAQRGETAPRMVPAALQETLFGGLDASGDGPALYTVLDAAKVPGLPEMLGASELAHACLFQGEAARELADVAPWLVRLEPDNSFTRGLFTRGEAGWHLWDRAAGIFLRSPHGMDGLRKHLRMFTKVRDDTGKWYYFRFWEAAYAEGLLRYGHPDTARRFAEGGAIITLDPVGQTASLFEPPHEEAPAHQGAFHLYPQDVAALSEVSVHRFARRLADWLLSAYDRATPRPEMDRFALRGIMHARRALGLADERSVADYVAASWLLGCAAETRLRLPLGPELPEVLQKAHRDIAAAQTQSIGLDPPAP